LADNEVTVLVFKKDGLIMLVKDWICGVVESLQH